MATDREPFEKLDESLNPAIDRIRTAAHKVQAPPDLLAKSMERIRQLPLPPTRKRPTARGLLTKSVETIRQFRWLSWVTPLAPVFAVLLVMVLNMNRVQGQLAEVTADLVELMEQNSRIEEQTRLTADEAVARFSGPVMKDRNIKLADVTLPIRVIINTNDNNIILCGLKLEEKYYIEFAQTPLFIPPSEDVKVSRNDGLCSGELVVYLPRDLYEGMVRGKKIDDDYGIIRVVTHRSA